MIDELLETERATFRLKPAPILLKSRDADTSELQKFADTFKNP